jgi:polysaccharide biosynthesis transport protein
VATHGELGHGEGRPIVPRIVQVARPLPADDVVGPSGAFRLGEVSPIDLRRLLSALHRRLGLIGLTAATVMALVVAYTLLTTPKYQAIAEVMLDPRNKTVTKADDVLSQLPADSVVVDSEVEVLRSPQLSKRVVQSLKLDQDPEFRRGRLRRLPPGPLTGRPLQQVVNAVGRNLSVSRMGLTDVIQIGFRSASPAKASRVANEFANLYLAQQVEQKVDATNEASQWLNQRLAQIRSQVLADDTAVQQFKIANNLLSAQGTTLTEQEISNYNQSLAQATAQVAEDQARFETARRQLALGSNGDDVGEALNSPTIEKLKEQRAEVSRQVAALQAQFLDGYPKLETARNELKDIDSEIRAETQRIISNLDAKVQVSRRRAAAIDSTLASTRGELATNDRASVKLDEL